MLSPKPPAGKGALPEVYAASLDALGFTWDLQKGPRSKPAVVSWEHRYDQLAAYQVRPWSRD